MKINLGHFTKILLFHCVILSSLLQLLVAQSNELNQQIEIFYYLIIRLIC